MNATVHPCPRAGSALWVFLAVVTVALVILFLVFGATTVSTRVVLTGGMPATASVQPWTPEQIAADPNGYMTWALAEVSQNEKRLQQQAQSLQVETTKAKRNALAHLDSLADTKARLAAAKTAYRVAIGEQRWPIPLEGRSFREDELKAHVLETSAQADALARLVQGYADNEAALANKTAELDRRLSELRKLRAKLGEDAEVLRANTLLAEAEGLSMHFAEIQASAQVLLQEPGPLELGGLERAEPAPNQDAAFDRIMAEE